MTEPEFSWTQDAWGDEAEIRAPRVATRNERLAWLTVIVLAVVAFEWTADPALSASLGCVKFGWDEFRLARWLMKTDPDRERGRVCSKFYLAWGLWRISLVASGLMMIIAFVHGSIEGKPAPGAAPPPGLMGCVMTMLVGFLLSSVVSSLAVASALRHRVRVWVGPEVHWARKDGVWPPQSARRRRDSGNWARVILLSALITNSVFSLAIPLAFAFPNPRLPTNVGVSLLMGFMLGVPVLILVLLKALSERMIAPTPEVCWADVRTAGPIRSVSALF